jgi:SAM-dependent methyltransferase
LHYKETDIILDFGCGIGRYAQFFNKKQYIGYDPVEKAIEIAKERNPEHHFTTKIPDNANIGLFFTVLQHIPVKKWDFLGLQSLKTIFLFENTSENQDKNYIFFRSEGWYEQQFRGKIIQKANHFLHYNDANGLQQTEKHTFWEIKL